MTSLWRAEGRTLADKGWAPLRYWAAWWALLCGQDNDVKNVTELNREIV